MPNNPRIRRRILVTCPVCNGRKFTVDPDTRAHVDCDTCDGKGRIRVKLKND